MTVVEEPADHLGRWFARYDEHGEETFSARLLNVSDTLEIAWTANIREIIENIVAVQQLIERDVPTVTGVASDGIERVITAGRFRSALYAKQLSRHVGGKWNVKVEKRSDVINEVWDVVAMRMGDE